MHWQFGEMEFGEMKLNTSNWSNLACFYVARVWQRQLGFLVITYCFHHYYLFTIFVWNKTFLIDWLFCLCTCFRLFQPVLVSLLCSGLRRKPLRTAGWNLPSKN